MSLKNVLIIVDNIDESIDFYEELFGLHDAANAQLPAGFCFAYDGLELEIDEE